MNSEKNDLECCILASLGMMDDLVKCSVAERWMGKEGHYWSYTLQCLEDLSTICYYVISCNVAKYNVGEDVNKVHYDVLPMSKVLYCFSICLYLNCCAIVSAALTITILMRSHHYAQLLCYCAPRCRAIGRYDRPLIHVNRTRGAGGVVKLPQFTHLITPPS